jgi:hypothetical protein
MVHQDHLVRQETIQEHWDHLDRQDHLVQVADLLVLWDHLGHLVIMEGLLAFQDQRVHLEKQVHKLLDKYTKVKFLLLLEHTHGQCHQMFNESKSLLLVVVAVVATGSI